MEPYQRSPSQISEVFIRLEFFLLKLLRTAARTEKWGARRVGVLKVRRASRCGALIFSGGSERGTLWQPKKIRVWIELGPTLKKIRADR